MHNSSKMESETGDIVFTGSEGLTCHQFIRAIREEAMKAEKQTDNRWIADYASIRFDGDALKWFENLEDETQTDWRLLRRAILSHYSEPAYAEAVNTERSSPSSPGLVFSGTDKEECRAFVREVRQRALAQGKENDSDWMIRLAISSLAGSALEWYVALAGEVQNEWRLLERAILIDYPLPPTLALLSGYTNPTDEEARPSGSDKNLPVLAFTGKDKDDCRSFVQHIRLAASGEGKQDDSTWTAKLAYPCFSGKALDWYASLPPDVQQDWRRLERAILLDFPIQPTLAIAPARIHIADWYWRIRPSTSILGLQSREDWLAQARERRRMYLEANDKSIPCWLLVESEADIPENAIPTGPMLAGGADYSARAWQEQFGLVVGKCNRQLDGAHLPLRSQELHEIRPFEVLVGDPCHFQWIVVPLKSTENAIVHRPFEAVEAGMDKTGNNVATFISQGFHAGGWHPGKVHSGDSVMYFCWGWHEHQSNSVRVLAWAD